MTSSLWRATISVSLAIGAVAGCASRNPRGQPGAPTMTAADVERGGERPIEAVLQAKAAGALVTRTEDGGIAVQIRGPGSVYGSNEPLYLVDDVEFRPGPGGALRGINPHDIESIEVLKNPADIGIYGVKGANGVIKIKTKKPGRRRD